MGDGVEEFYKKTYGPSGYCRLDTENRPSRRQIRAALKSGPQAVDLLRIIFA
jgi:hypothetical protein